MIKTWQYIGCNIEDLPKNILKNSKKLDVDQIKEILNDIPLVNGTAQAIDTDSLTRTLISDGIFPLRIRPYNKIDYRINNLKKLQQLVYSKHKSNKISGDESIKESLKIINEIPKKRKRFRPSLVTSKLRLLLYITLTIAIIYLLTKDNIQLITNYIFN